MVTKLSNTVKLGSFMFIPVIHDSNRYDEELVGFGTNKYKNAVDILSCKRNIIVHNDLDLKRSAFDGIHNIKCTIINLSVLDGNYHYDTEYNPEKVLVKSVYNGYLTVPLNAVRGELKITRDFISKGDFKLLSAYTSHLGVWSVTGDNDISSPFGVSILNMIDLKYAVINSRQHVSMYGANASIKMEISFDGDNYQLTLPLPYPQFYSRMHSELHGDDPIITRNRNLKIEELCDEDTKISLVNFTRKFSRGDLDYQYDSDMNSELVYYDKDGEKYEPFNDSEIPLHVQCGLVGSLSDELFSKIFKIFYRYQLSKMDFLYDSARNIFTVESVNFSYKDAPKDLIKSVIFDFVDDSKIHNAFTDISTYYGPATIIGRITDLKYDLTINFTNGHKNIPKLKTVRYSSSIFDIFNSLTSFETSVKSPITMMEDSYYGRRF